MRIWLKALIAVVAVVSVVGITLLCLWFPVKDNEKNYLEKVNGLDIFENTIEDALPQTEIYGIIKNHFESPLPKGKTVKKAIVLGYDGCRLDALTNIAENKDGAMSDVLGEGGKAYISYCGGTKYPEKNTQDTSTAPGWCSMLTGQWADVHKITGNGIVKSNDYLTLLTTLVEDETINSSAFYVSWKGHFTNDNSTYRAEKEYTEKNKLNVKFACADNDDCTRANVLADLGKTDCSDFIFSIFEYCDHCGHTLGFFSERSSYKKAFINADNAAMKAIEKIKSRDTYESEDWLIILTSDHGGKGRDHGKASIQERDTFIITNKEMK